MKKYFLAVLLALGGCGPNPDRLFDRAMQEHFGGKWGKTYQLARKGRLSRDENTGDPWYWQFLLLEAEAQIYSIHLNQAKALLKETPPSADAFLLLRGKRAMLLGLADLYEGHQETARSRFEEAHGLALQAKDKALMAKIELFRSWLFSGLGKPQIAENHAINAMDFARGANEPFVEAQAANELSFLRIKDAKYDAALDLLESIVDTVPAAWYFKGRMLTNLGLCASRLGFYEQGRTYLEEAMKLHQSKGKRDGIFNTYGELGNNAFFQGDFDTAANDFRKAYELAAEENDKPMAALWAGNLAAFYIQLEDWDEAGAWNEIAERVARESGNIEGKRHGGYRRLNRAIIVAGKGHIGQAIELFEEIDTNESLPDLRWQALACLGRIYARLGRIEPAIEVYECALAEVDRALEMVTRDDSEMSYFSRLVGLHRDYVDFLVDQEMEWKAFEVAESTRARVLRDRLGSSRQLAALASIGEIHRLAASRDMVFLSYWLAPERSFLWVFDSEDKRLIELPSSDIIDGLVREYRNTMKAGHDFLTNPIAEGTELYRILVSPLEPYLAKRPRVVLVPDGSLHGLNFEALTLPGEPTSGYLLDHVTLTIAPSLQLFASGDGGAGIAPEEMLLIGDPYPVDADYPRLKYARMEIESIQEIFPSSNRSFTDLEAHPQIYRTADPARFSKIHFSAHGIANWEQPLESAVILARTPRTGSYKLYARNVLDIPIRAEVVTISCCTSAGSRIYAGEGLIGFAWAFLQAGARNVVAGAWKVDDRATALLMDAFYENVQKEMAIPEALAEAKRWMVRQEINPHYKKPFFWAAFQVYAR